MAKIQLQFQAGMSLNSFLSEYGTEEQCRKALFKASIPSWQVGSPSPCAVRHRKTVVQDFHVIASQLPLTCL
jgi:hypothetical protein